MLTIVFAQQIAESAELPNGQPVSDVSVEGLIPEQAQVPENLPRFELDANGMPVQAEEEMDEEMPENEEMEDEEMMEEDEDEEMTENEDKMMEEDEETMDDDEDESEVVVEDEASSAVRVGFF